MKINIESAEGIFQPQSFLGEIRRRNAIAEREETPKLTRVAFVHRTGRTYGAVEKVQFGEDYVVFTDWENSRSGARHPENFKMIPAREIQEASAYRD